MIELVSSWAVWIGAILLAGVIGSAGWDLAKFIGRHLLRACMNAVSRSMKKGADDVFSLAAFRSRRIAGILILVLVVIVVVFFSIELSSRLIAVSAGLPPDTVTTPVPEFVAIRRYVVLPLLVVFLILIYLLLRIVFIVLSAAYVADRFEHALDLLAPALTVQKERDLRRAFALMRTAEEHREIVRRLNEVASSANLSLPNFPKY